MVVLSRCCGPCDGRGENVARILQRFENWTAATVLMVGYRVTSQDGELVCRNEYAHTS